MKKKAVIIFILSLVLTACTQHTPSDKTPVVGEAVDSVAIANDTVQQENIEGSYEYAQTIIVSPQLAYDVRAYGGPASRGQYCILRRGADNKTDTVAQEERKGRIVNAFVADLNGNGNEEIYVVIRKISNQACYIVGYEFDHLGKPTPIDFGNSGYTLSINYSALFSSENNQINDTIYLEGNTIREAYKYHEKKDTTSISRINIYKLDGNKCRLKTSL